MELEQLYNQQHAIKYQIFELSRDARKVEELLNRLSAVEEQIRKLEGR